MQGKSQKKAIVVSSREIDSVDLHSNSLNGSSLKTILQNSWFSTKQKRNRTCQELADDILSIIPRLFPADKNGKKKVARVRKLKLDPTSNQIKIFETLWLELLDMFIMPNVC